MFKAKADVKRPMKRMNDGQVMYPDNSDYIAYVKSRSGKFIKLDHVTVPSIEPTTG